MAITRIPRFGRPKHEARNHEICRTFVYGLSQAALARRYDLSPSMISIILYRAALKLYQPFGPRPVYEVYEPPPPPTPEQRAASKAAERAERRKWRRQAAASFNAVFPPD